MNELQIPEYSKVRFKIVNSSINFINNVKNKIKKTYPNVEIKHEKKELEILTEELILTDNKIYTDDMISEEVNKIEYKYRGDVKVILNNELKKHTNHLNGKKIWKLLKLEFSNLLTYGENNIFNFEKLDNYEITGLCGSNSIGKSSLIDILLIGLYNDFSRNETSKRTKHKHGLSSSIVNHNYKSFKIKTSFQVGQNLYYIIKEGNIKEKNSALYFTKYNLVQIIGNIEKVLSCGLTHKENTLNQIESLIGSYTDFCVSSLSFQSNVNHNLDFYKMSSYQRKKFLNEHFNLEYFDEIKKKYTKMLTDTKLKLSNIKGKLENNNFCDEDIQKINIIKKEIKELQYKFTELKKENINLKNQKDNLKFIHIDNYFTETDIEKFKQKKNKITKKITKLNLKLDKLNLIKNKQEILNKNEKYETEKRNKIENLLFEIRKSNSTINFENYQYLELNEIKCILKSIIDENKKQLNNYDNNKRNIIVNNINNLEKVINNNEVEYIEITTEMRKYYKCSNYTDYKYDLYTNNYKRYIENKNLFELLTKIYDNCNNECSCCINITELITEYLEKNNLNFDFNIKKIIKKYNKYNKLYKIHNAIKNNNKREYINLIISVLENNKSDLVEFDIQFNNYNNEIILFENHIISIENIIIKRKIKEIQESHLFDYIILQKEIEINNKLTKKIEKYKNDLLEINKNIENYNTYNNISKINENNKLLYEELNLQIEDNDKQLFEYNNNIIKLELHVDKLISSEKIYNELIDKFNILDKEKNIFIHINKLVDSNGLPLKIIQNKLKNIEVGVSNMLYKIIKKKIVISEDITNIFIDIIDKDGLISSYFGGMEFFICTLCFTPLHI